MSYGQTLAAEETHVHGGDIDHQPLLEQTYEECRSQTGNVILAFVKRNLMATSQSKFRGGQQGSR